MHQPFPHRLQAAIWAAEWPLGASFGIGTPLPQQECPVNLTWAWSRTKSVMDALAGDGDPVPLDSAHRLLDELERWTAMHNAFLTWPATPLGFARALHNSARNQDPALMVVLVAYPQFCERMLAAAHLIEPSLPAHVAALLGRPEAVRPRPAPPRAPPPPSAAEAEPPEALPLVRSWAKALEEVGTQPALARQCLDQQIKALTVDRDWKWFERTLLPALLALSSPELERIVAAWPPHQRFVPNDAEAWVDQPRFWRELKGAGADVREVMMTRGFAACIDLDEAGPTVRLGMLTKMMPFARSAQVFSLRLKMWQSLGGDLDADARPPEDADARTPEGVSRTARQWIETMENPEWNKAMEELKSGLQRARFVRGGP